MFRAWKLLCLGFAWQEDEAAADARAAGTPIYIAEESYGVPEGYVVGVDGLESGGSEDERPREEAVVKQTSPLAGASCWGWVHGEMGWSCFCLG
jgi:hypothetical protein